MSGGRRLVRGKRVELHLKRGGSVQGRYQAAHARYYEVELEGGATRRVEKQDVRAVTVCPHKEAASG